MRHRVGLLLASLTLTAAAQSTQYVSDVLTITVRSGQGNEYQILRTIESGTPLEVLEQTAEGYSRVRLPDGTVGWALTRFLQPIPAARERLAEAERRIETLGAENAALTEQRAALREGKDRAETELAEAQAQVQSLREEVDRLSELAAKPEALEARNAELRERIAQLDSEGDLLRQRNLSLKSDAERMWFLTGGGVLLGGFILGLIIPRIRWRKRSSWDTF